MALALGVPSTALPGLLAVATLAAVAFAAVQLLLTTLFGRAGQVISLLLAVLQLTASGGLFPIQLVAEPFQVISNFVPISHAISAAQLVLAAAPAAQWVSSLVALAGMAVVPIALTLVLLARRRGAVATGVVARARLEPLPKSGKPRHA